MAKIVLRNLSSKEFGGTPYGNHQVRPFRMQTGPTGVPLGAIATPLAGSAVGLAAAAALAVGDVVVLGPLRNGMRIDSATLLVSTPIAGLAGKLGFVYADGVDDTQQKATAEGRPFVPQDDAYFFAAGESLAAQKRKVTDTFKAPVTLPKDALLVLTVTGGPSTGAGRVDVMVQGEDRGAL